MPFSKVEKQSASRGEPKISLRKSNSIGINTKALEEYFEDSVEYAEIYYDEENNQLGINALEEETEDSYTLSITESGGTIAPTSFLNSKGLVPSVTKQYSPDTRSLNGDIELVVIDLDNPVATYGSPDDDSEGEEE